MQAASVVQVPERLGEDTAAVVRQIAHELRQPLSIIESIAYYLEIVLPHSEVKAREQIEKLQQVVHQANWIISDAVDYCQVSPPHPELVDLTELVSNCVAELRGSERIRTLLRLPERSTLVRLDPGQAHHLLRNLLMFFHLISDREVDVVVELAPRGYEFVLELRTLSARCSAADLQASLECFEPLPDSTAGLAMACARRILHAHGGRMGVYAEPRDGLVLEVVLPAAN